MHNGEYIKVEGERLVLRKPGDKARFKDRMWHEDDVQDRALDSDDDDFVFVVGTVSCTVWYPSLTEV